jgi:hypothetical protein
MLLLFELLLLFEKLFGVEVLLASFSVVVVVVVVGGRG